MPQVVQTKYVTIIGIACTIVGLLAGFIGSAVGYGRDQGALETVVAAADHRISQLEGSAKEIQHQAQTFQLEMRKDIGDLKTEAAVANAILSRIEQKITDAKLSQFLQESSGALAQSQ